MRRGSKVIVIDPRETWIATRADLFLQIRPGTDNALALAMLNVVVSEDLVDRAIIDKWCHGYDQLAERVKQFAPEWAEPITWVPAEKMRQAARMYATNRPAGIEIGRPVEGVPEGNQAIMNIHRLIAITGNLDVPGGSVICRPAYGVTTYPYSTEEVIQLYGEELHWSLSEKRIGADKYPLVKNFRAWAQEEPSTSRNGNRRPHEIPVYGSKPTTTRQPGPGSQTPPRSGQEARFQRGGGFVHDPDRAPDRRCRSSRGQLAGKGLDLLYRRSAEYHPQSHRCPRVQIGLGDQLHFGQAFQSSGGALGQRAGDAFRPDETVGLHFRTDDRQGLGSRPRRS